VIFLKFLNRCADNHYNKLYFLEESALNKKFTTLAEVEERLGKPAVRGDNYLIYNGDSLKLMGSLENSSIPLTVTSPPYNIGKEYESVVDVADYLDWCQKWLGEIHRITTENGALWLNLGYLSIPDKAKAVPIPYLLWDRIQFYLLQEVVWTYGAGVSTKKSFCPRNEKFLWYVKNELEYHFNLDAVRDPNVKYPNQKKNGKLRCNPLGKNPGDVWHFPKVTSGKDRSSKERTGHPAQFPIAVIDRIVKACSQPGEIIFDPFLGSGTVVECALRNDRLAVGFEIEKKYIGIAKKRIENFLSQPSLF